MQLLRQPDVVPRQPMVRTLMVWEEGDRTEEWLAGLLEKAYPNLVGLRQMCFFFPVPLTSDWMIDDLTRQIEATEGLRLWGMVRENFTPPSVRMGEDGRVKIRHAANNRMGFVLDPPASIVYVPCFVDFVIQHPTMGLVVCEAKSMSDFSFKRAVMGSLDYKKQCQLVGLAEATQMHVSLLAYRKQTSHLAEIFYVRGVEHARIHITQANGQQEVYFARGGQITTEAGGPATLPADGLWETAEVWAPFNERLLGDIRKRILRVLFPERGRWWREYGPEFLCRACAGRGEIVCKNCLGTGIGKTSTTGKQCGRCKGVLTQACDRCEGAGTFNEVELSFPCSYCPVIGECYPMATLEIDSKPHYKITRAAWQESGLSFVSPGDVSEDDE